jgi:hypothetical protein
MPDFSDVSGSSFGAGDPDRTAPAIQRAIEYERGPVFTRVRGYQDLLDPQLRSWRLGATLRVQRARAGHRGSRTLSLASCHISSRSALREISVRLALGATRGVMWRMVVHDALRLVTLRIVVGGGVAMAAAPPCAGCCSRRRRSQRTW